MKKNLNKIRAMQKKTRSNAETLLASGAHWSQLTSITNLIVSFFLHTYTYISHFNALTLS